MESKRIDPSSSSPSSSSASLPNNVHGSSSAPDGSGNHQHQLSGSRNTESTSDDEDGQTKEEIAQVQEGDTHDNSGSTPGVQPPVVDAPAVLGTDDAADKRPPADLQGPPVPVATKERTIDNWPGRAVCRDVSEKFLSWEFQDGDFTLPAAQEGSEGEVADSCFGDMEQQREEQAAVRSALIRRQSKLLVALKDLKTNEEAGIAGAG